MAIVKNTLLPEFKNYFVAPENKNSKWGHLLLTWNQQLQDRIITHKFSPVVNLTSGEIYLDCTKNKIYVKIFAHTLVRPVLTPFYVLQKVISIKGNIYKSVSNDINKDEQIKRIALNALTIFISDLTDIPKIIICSTILTALSALVLVVIPFGYTDITYDARDLLGKIIRFMHNDRYLMTRKDVFICFSPISNLEAMKKGYQLTCATTKRLWHPKGVNRSDISLHLLNFTRNAIYIPLNLRTKPKKLWVFWINPFNIYNHFHNVKEEQFTSSQYNRLEKIQQQQHSLEL